MQIPSVRVKSDSNLSQSCWGPSARTGLHHCETVEGLLLLHNEEWENGKGKAHKDKKMHQNTESRSGWVQEAKTPKTPSRTNWKVTMTYMGFIKQSANTVGSCVPLLCYQNEHGRENCQRYPRDGFSDAGTVETSCKLRKK